MKTFVIIEDEKPAARRLERIINDLGYEVHQKLHSVEESIEWFRQQPKVDLIFLDIQLSDGLSFEIFEKVKVEADIIFTTAYDEYALKAFKLNSIDYLLKTHRCRRAFAGPPKIRKKTYSQTHRSRGFEAFDARADLGISFKPGFQSK